MRLIIAAFENSIYYKVVSLYDCGLYLVPRYIYANTCNDLFTVRERVSGEQNGGGADSLGANSAKPGRHHTTIGGK